MLNLCLISFSMMRLKIIHDVVCVENSFPYIMELSINMDLQLFIYSPAARLFPV